MSKWKLYLILIGIVIILSACLFIAFYKNSASRFKDEIDVSENEFEAILDTTEASPIPLPDNKKDTVYDATYEKNVPIKSYVNKESDYTFSVDNITLPYINLDTVEAANANKEIKALHDKLIQEYIQCAQDGALYVTSSYDYSINGGTLSIVITVERGGRDIPTQEKFEYNLKTE